MDTTWIENLTDKSYRVTFDHPDIIKCSVCDFNCASKHDDNPCCSNIVSYPIMSHDFGCKNGRMKKEAYKTINYSLIDKMKCKLGMHQTVWIGQSHPFMIETLEKCNCCGKYGLWNRALNSEIWFKPKHKEKYLSKECLEMINKYNL